LPKLVDLKVEHALLNLDTVPDGPQEVFFCDEVPAALQQFEQEVCGLGPERNRMPFAEQSTIPHVETIGPELEDDWLPV
jgi:hypothetical protein